MIIFLALVLVFVLLFTVFLADAFFGGLDFASNRQVADTVVKIIRGKKLAGGNFYDLGSARGSFAVKIAGAMPLMEITGIDNNWFRVLAAKARTIFLKNAHFEKANIFAADLSPANIVYIYLPQELMPNLQTKLQKELKPGATIITNRVKFPDWQPIEILNQIFIYAKK